MAGATCYELVVWQYDPEDKHWFRNRKEMSANFSKPVYAGDTINKGELSVLDALDLSFPLTVRKIEYSSFADCELALHINQAE